MSEGRQHPLATWLPELPTRPVPPLCCPSPRSLTHAYLSHSPECLRSVSSSHAQVTLPVTILHLTISSRPCSIPIPFPGRRAWSVSPHALAFLQRPLSPANFLKTNFNFFGDAALGETPGLLLTCSVAQSCLTLCASQAAARQASLPSPSPEVCSHSRPLSR